MNAERSLRADAARNRAQVMEAAETLIAERGFGVPVSEIAKKVGVGVGTVYRHFPTKEALFEAILTRKMHELSAGLREFAERDDPAAAFGDSLAYVIERAGRDRSLYEGLAAAADVDLGPGSELGAEMFDAEGRLLERAQEVGVVRRDFGPVEFKSFVAGCIVMAERGVAPARVVELALKALAP
ncbi:TetR/AcrR family transcriptional regulator [Glycomyces arizonensis]|uniref:TetR/AcrR family transcriptional regulator n=1 Tax=Glycomyces arizonensis TaxID=256035 RepID=UPI0004133EB8|nr:TetR/AcrR family transcriptional regulator [Glycomyces arizonensis]